MRLRRGRQSPCGYSYNDIPHRGSGQVYVLGLLVACRSTGARKKGLLARNLHPSARQLSGSSSPTSRCRPLSTNIESIYCNLRPIHLARISVAVELARSRRSARYLRISEEEVVEREQTTSSRLSDFFTDRTPIKPDTIYYCIRTSTTYEVSSVH